MLQYTYPKNFQDTGLFISKFASQGTDKEKTIQPESVRIAIDNIKLLNDKAFATDEQLIREIHVCKLCNNKLLVKADRPSHVTVYTESYGTVIGAHYHKYCQAFKRGCSFRQYYGYSSSTPVRPKKCSSLEKKNFQLLRGNDISYFTWQGFIYWGKLPPPPPPPKATPFGDHRMLHVVTKGSN